MTPQPSKEFNAMALGMVPGVAVSGLLDTLLLWEFSRAGVIEGGMVLLYGVAVGDRQRYLLLIIRSGVNLRYKLSQHDILADGSGVVVADRINDYYAACSRLPVPYQFFHHLQL